MPNIVQIIPADQTIVKFEVLVGEDQYRTVEKKVAFWALYDDGITIKPMIWDNQTLSAMDAGAYLGQIEATFLGVYFRDMPWKAADFRPNSGQIQDKSNVIAGG